MIIASYTDSHLPILLECLAHHKHVLCEKPIARTLEEGQAFVEAVQKAPEKVLIAHILRHNRSYQKVRELVQEGAIGELRLLRMVQNHHAMNWSRYCRLLRCCAVDHRLVNHPGFRIWDQDTAGRAPHQLHHGVLLPGERLQRLL